MAVLFFLTLMVGYYILFQRIRSYQKQSLVPFAGTTILLTVIGTQIYDKLVLSIGFALGEGPLLQAVSIPRHLFNAIFTPLLVVTAFEFISRAGLKWAGRRIVLALAWILALSLIAYEFTAGLMTASLVADEYLGVTRYIPAGVSSLSAGVVSALFLITGLVLLSRARWIWLAFGSGLFLAASLAPALPYSPLAFAGIEALFLWALVASENRLVRKGYELSSGELDKRLTARMESAEK